MGDRLDYDPTGDILDEQTLLGKRLKLVILNSCNSDKVGLKLLNVAPHLAVVCWSTLSEDSAVREFAAGFFDNMAQQLHGEPAKRGNTLKELLRSRKRKGIAGPFSTTSVAVESAFRAGCAAFTKAGFRFGNPADYLHPHGHPHLWRPDFRRCALYSVRLLGTRCFGALLARHTIKESSVSPCVPLLYHSCPGCSPPVHGRVICLTIDPSTSQAVQQFEGTNPPDVSSRLTSTTRGGLAALAASVLNTGVILLIIDANFMYAPFPFNAIPITNKITDIDKLYY